MENNENILEATGELNCITQIPKPERPASQMIKEKDERKCNKQLLKVYCNNCKFYRASYTGYTYYEYKCVIKKTKEDYMSKKSIYHEITFSHFYTLILS